MLPIFSPRSRKRAPSHFVASDEDFLGSYLERVTKIVSEVLNSSSEVVRFYEDASSDSDVEEEVEERYSSSKLFLNEVDQLQTQMCLILSVPASRSGCGFAQS